LTVSGGQFRVCGSWQALKGRSFAFLAFALEGRFFSDAPPFLSGSKKNKKFTFVSRQETRQTNM
jgi:hypothetical protein